jgi:Kef-type K+ transport system membrane component KefB
VAVSDVAVALILAGAILVASMVSVEAGISVALIELALGVFVGNAIHNITIPDWLSFVGSFAGIVLTFLAGAEVDVPQFRREWKASVSIGIGSFFGPFVTVGLLAYYGLSRWRFVPGTRPRSSPPSRLPGATTSSCSGTEATFSATTSSDRPPTESPSTRRAR